MTFLASYPFSTVFFLMSGVTWFTKARITADLLSTSSGSFGEQTLNTSVSLSNKATGDSVGSCSTLLILIKLVSCLVATLRTHPPSLEFGRFKGFPYLWVNWRREDSVFFQLYRLIVATAPTDRSHFPVCPVDPSPGGAKWSRLHLQ